MDPLNRPPTLYPPSEPPATMNVSEREEEITLTFNVAGQAATIQALISDHFNILHSNPTFPAPLHDYDIIMLGEIHTDDNHAQVNARIVDFIWNSNKNSILLTEDDSTRIKNEKGELVPPRLSQARHVRSDIPIGRWDRSVERIEAAYAKLQTEIKDCERFLIESQKEIEEVQTHIDSSDQIPTKDYFKQKSEDTMGGAWLVVDANLFYMATVKEADAQRDSNMQREIFAARGTQQNRKIVLIAGNAHVQPFAELLNNQRLTGLALSIKEGKGEPQNSSVISISDFYKDLDTTPINKLPTYTRQKLQQLINMPQGHNIAVTQKANLLTYLCKTHSDYFKAQSRKLYGENPEPTPENFSKGSV